MSTKPEPTVTNREPSNWGGSHSSSVDQARRADGACAQVHLPTGRMCTLRYRHPGTCEFVAPSDISNSLADRRNTEGW